MKREMVTDHTGKTYANINEMCKAWNVNICTYMDRIKRKGLTVEQALTGNFEKYKRDKDVSCVDHKGNTYNSLEEMCDFYGISTATYKNRLKDGLTVEEALTKAKYSGTKKPIQDHLGNEYDSLKALCSAYGIKECTFIRRKNLGWSLEEILDKKGRKFVDDFGKSWNSVLDMCSHYDIPYVTYRKYYNQGYTLKQIIDQDYIDWVTDHNGNKYKSVSDMCEAYNVNISTYNSRLKKGWSQERALTESSKVTNSKPIIIKDNFTDLEFNSVKEFTECCGISIIQFYKLKHAGMSDIDIYNKYKGIVR